MSVPTAIAVRQRAGTGEPGGDDASQVVPLPIPEGPHRAGLALPTEADLDRVMTLGRMIHGSKLFPKLPNAEAAAVVALYGMQLRLDAVTACKDIDFIEGKPVCNAGLINSLIVRDHGGEALIPEEFSPTRVTIRYKRREWSEYREQTLEIGDVPAVLKGKANWINYPGDMLWARLISRIGRQSFADSLKGIYTRDEIEETRAIEATARVVERPATPKGHPAPKPRATPTTTPAPAIAAEPQDEDQTPPPTTDGNGNGARAKVIETWRTNIGRAKTVARLDEIAAMLANTGLAEEAELMEALVARMAELGTTETAAP